jgi:hypothetical protein
MVRWSLGACRLGARNLGLVTLRRIVIMTSFKAHPIRKACAHLCWYKCHNGSLLQAGTYEGALL